MANTKMMGKCGSRFSDRRPCASCIFWQNIPKTWSKATYCWAIMNVPLTIHILYHVIDQNHQNQSTIFDIIIIHGASQDDDDDSRLMPSSCVAAKWSWMYTGVCYWLKITTIKMWIAQNKEKCWRHAFRIHLFKIVQLVLFSSQVFFQTARGPYSGA